MESKDHLSGVLKALEQNNAIPPEEKAKRSKFAEEEAAKASASLIKPLRTYESDAAEAIDREKHSLYSISQAEKAKKKRKKETDPEKEEIRKNSLLLLMSGVLFLAGGAFLLYFFLIKGLLTPPPVKAPVIDSIIPTGHQQIVTDPPEQTGAIASAIKSAMLQDQLGPDSIENLKITRDGEDVTASDILLDLSNTAPASLIRSLDPSGYMLGLVSGSTTEPFFIVKVSYYDNAFAGMLAWESAGLANLFTGLTGANEGSTTALAAFQDDIVNNRNVRIARASNDSTLMLYSFYDQSTLILAPDEATFEDVLSGLQTSQLTR